MASPSPATDDVTPVDPEPAAAGGTTVEGERDDNAREIAPFPPRELGEMGKEEMEMKVGNNTDFMYLCMFISEFGKGLKFPMARWDFMGLFNDLTKSDIIEGFVKDILLKCLHALSKPVIYPAATTTDVEVSSRIERMIGKLFLDHGFESEILAGIKPIAEMEMDEDEEGRLIVEDPRQLVTWSERNVLERMRIIRFIFGQLFDIPGCLIPSSADTDVPESSTAILTYIPLRGQRETGRVLGFDRSGNRWWCIRDGEMGMRVWKEEFNGNVELAVWEAALLPAIAGSLEDEISRVKSELNRKVTDIKLNRHRSGETKKRKRGNDDDNDVIVCVACGEEVHGHKAPIRKRSSSAAVKAKDHPLAGKAMECPECSGPMHATCVRCYGCGGKSQRIQEDMTITSGPVTSTSGPMRCPNCHQLALARILKGLAEHVDQEMKAAERRGRRIAMKEKQEALAAARYAEALADAPGRRERKRVDYTSKAYDQQINRALRRSEHPDTVEEDDDAEEEDMRGYGPGSRREAQNLSREARLARRHEHQEEIAMGDAVAQAGALGSRTTVGGQRRSARVRTQRPGASRMIPSESSSGESDGELESSSSSSVSRDDDYIEEDGGDEDVRASEVEDDEEESDEDEEAGEVGGIAADVKREHRQREVELANIDRGEEEEEEGSTSSSSSSNSSTSMSSSLSSSDSSSER